jgi:hypothetical protein
VVVEQIKKIALRDTFFRSLLDEIDHVQGRHGLKLELPAINGWRLYGGRFGTRIRNYKDARSPSNSHGGKHEDSARTCDARSPN